MNAPKFSPGPWSVDHEGVVLSSQPGVAICSPYPCDTDSPHGYGYGETTAANARLIAAAPELYAQLESAVKLLKGLPGFAGTAQVESMRAALAKVVQP